MNTANLQIGGVSALVMALRRKGRLDEGEIEAALSSAEASVASNGRRPAEISPANIAAIAFPLHYLRYINSLDCGGDIPKFSSVAADICRRKSNGAASRAEDLAPHRSHLWLSDDRPGTFKMELR